MRLLWIVYSFAVGMDSLICYHDSITVDCNCLQAKEEEAKGDHVSALQHARTALYLNIAAVIFAVVVWIVWIAAVAASA